MIDMGEKAMQALEMADKEAIAAMQGEEEYDIALVFEAYYRTLCRELMIIVSMASGSTEAAGQWGAGYREWYWEHNDRRNKKYEEMLKSIEDGEA